MRVGVYGGSFNPPHVGHAMVAAWLGWTRRVDEVWLVPTLRHAFDKPLAPFPERLAACRALAEVVGPFVRVDTIEGELSAPSFTIETLRALARRSPHAQLHLVIGADLLPQLPQWREAETLLATWPLLVVGREGSPPVVDAPCFPGVSSTEVRARLRAGEDVQHLVPAAVLDVVRRWPTAWLGG